MSHFVPAWCAGQRVEVPVRNPQPNPQRVQCPSCGAPPYKECIDLEHNLPLYTGHTSRWALAVKRQSGR